MLWCLIYFGLSSRRKGVMIVSHILDNQKHYNYQNKYALTLCQIFWCYKLKNCVELINKDGQFICPLLGAYNMFTPWNLSYNVSTHAIWVGSSDTTMLSFWRYIARKNFPLNGDHNNNIYVFNIYLFLWVYLTTSISKYLSSLSKI